MSKIVRRLLSAATALVAGVGLTSAQESGEAADLTAVIALNGQPCGRVVMVAKRGDDDYLATCEDGNRYRVYVRDGRVIVEKTN